MITITDFKKLPFLLKKKYSKILFITDENIFNIYRKELNDIILNLNYKYQNTFYYVIKPGEPSKNLENKQLIEDYMFKKLFDRNSCIIALGGGVVGDLSGYIASTYMRGIEYYQVPTSLLAMVDSSIGGKTAIDNKWGKNLIGSFHLPQKIIIDVNFLKSLPNDEFINGMAEVIKIAIITKDKLWNFLIENDLNSIKNTNKILKLVKLSGFAKLLIVSKDLKENNKRIFLNYGHTIGHAIEALTFKKHGYCVSLGICYEMLLQRKNIFVTPFYLQNKIKLVLKKYGLPTKLDLKLNIDDIIKVIKLDKKSNKFILVSEIGKPNIYSFNSEDLHQIFNNQRLIKSNCEIIKSPICINTPSSKSETNRVLLLAAFGKGKISINNILISDDTCYMIDALSKLGIDITINGNNATIIGCNGNLPLNKDIKLFLGNSGTCLRFLTGVLSFISKKKIILDGDEYMRKRPIQDLIVSLQDFGVDIKTLNNNGYPPVIINGLTKTNSCLKISTNNSSQYLTGLLLGSSISGKEISIKTFGKMVSQKFVDMTINIMSKFGITVNYSENSFLIKPKYYKNPKEYTIQADASSSSYILALSALLGRQCIIKNLNNENIQGDLHYCKYALESFGYKIELNESHFRLYDKTSLLNDEIILDLDSSDTFLTWVVLACFLPYNTYITNIENQNIKECKRIDIIFNILKSAKVNIEKIGNDLKIKGQKNYNYKGIYVNCHNDHRIAMAMAIFGYFVKDVILDNYMCVNKTYPNFWFDMNNYGLNLEPYQTDNKKTKKVILIGMTASGKSTLGKYYSTKKNVFYTDIDNEIESIYKMKPCDIIKTKGWNVFRQIEADIFKKCLGSNFNMIISGGGLIENQINCEIMKEHIVIFIKRDINSIIKSLKKRNEGIWNLETINSVFKKRLPIYQKISDYQFLNKFNLDKSKKIFMRWLDNIIGNKFIKNNSFFLCLSADVTSINNLQEITQNVDAVELRGDLLSSYDFDFIDNQIFDLFSQTDKYIIFTFRTKKEWGKYEGDPTKFIERAIYNGVPIVDIELTNNSIIDRKNSLVIGSCHSNNWNDIQINVKFGHNFHKPDILKLVGPYGYYNQMQILTEKLTEKVIILESGLDGSLSRVKNNFLTPVTHPNLDSVAVGQLSVNQIQNIRKNLNINNYEKQFYLIGFNIKKSPSPYLHNDAFKNFNLNYNYKLFETLNINDIEKIIYKNNFGGASVTTPFKEKIIDYLDLISNDAKLIGAVNTIYKKNNKLIGSNTDWYALYNLMKNNINENTYGCVIGSGGAARAACYSMNKLNLKFDIFCRNKNKCELLKQIFNINSISSGLSNKYNLVIICVPNNVNLNINNLSKDCLILDMSYNKNNPRNIFGRKLIDGYLILAEQAKWQLHLWENIITDVYFDSINKFTLLN